MGNRKARPAVGNRKVSLSTLSPAPGSRRKAKRVGRGPGSGHGKTATRGNKGQLSRSGSKQYAGFEGGQNPLHRRIPKRGFTNIFKRDIAVVNLGDLDKLEGEITPEAMVTAGVIRRIRDGVKVLGGGEIKKALIIHAHGFSQSARDKIAAAGGRAELIAGKAPVAKGK